MSGHKRFSPSASKRWLGTEDEPGCPGSIALAESLPESERIQGDSLASRRGTCAHAVGEMVLEAGIQDEFSAAQAADYLGMTVEKVVVDESIVIGAQVYIDYGKPLIDGALEGNGEAFIEERYSLGGYVQEFQLMDDMFTEINGDDLGGTSDLTICAPKILHVIDYKNGTGYVKERGNTQALTYALGALDQHRTGYQFEEVHITIVQPNAPGEAIRTWVVTPKFVYEWAFNTMLPGVERCIEAAEVLRSDPERFFQDYLHPSDDNCTFCPARGRCARRLDQINEEALAEFSGLIVLDDADQVLPNPTLLTPGQEQAILEHGDAMISFIQEVQARALGRAKEGTHVDKFKLVRGRRGHRYFHAEQDEVVNIGKRLGLRTVDLFEEPKLKSPAKVEQAMKMRGVSKENMERFNRKLVDQPEGSLKLVPDSDKRDSARPTIEAEFEHLFDSSDDILEL